MKPVPDVSIVLVNYNQPEYTAQCLDSIAEAPPQSSYELILVDNASADGSAGWLEQHYPQVKLIRSPKNGGIAGGNNLGIRAAAGRYILLLNNDTLVIPGTIDQTVQFLEAHSEAGGVGGNLLNEDGSFQSGYADFHTLWNVFLIISKLGMLFNPVYPSHPRSQSQQAVDWMSTAFMTFRREALEAVGLVDEEYFIYSDETDLQYKLKQAGWKIYYLQDLETTHFGGKSLNAWRRRRLVYRGFLLFFRNHRGTLQLLLLRLMFIAACLLKLPFWAAAWLVPKWKERARVEWQSNLAILQMCVKPVIEAP